MTKTALRVLSFWLFGALLLWVRTIFFTPGSTVTESNTTSFTTQSYIKPIHESAPQGNYIPFDPNYDLKWDNYGLQKTQWSREKSTSRSSWKKEMIDNSWDK